MRAAQVQVEALPTILCGVVEVGLMHHMVGAEGIRRASGEKDWKSTFRGWLSNGKMKTGLMFDHGNSVRAAFILFILFILGLRLNLGLIAWLGGQYGWRRGGVWVAATILVGHLLQLAVPKPARFEDHTHAFDEDSYPFASGGNLGFAFARGKVAAKFEALELAFVPMLAALGRGVPGLPRGLRAHELTPPGRIRAGRGTARRGRTAPTAGRRRAFDPSSRASRACRIAAGG